jgi:putative lipoic acid-binding regulatory protein
LNEETLLEFPCTFPLKVMGLNQPAFEQYVVEIVRTHAGSAALGVIDTRPSRNGRYIALTINFTASSQAQLDDIYRTLSASEQVLFLL